MPGMNGDEVLGPPQVEPGDADIPVIIVTSHELDARCAAARGRAHAILHKKDLSMETLERALDGIETAARA
jgi:CheY-like chemotaxis protein